ncbi:MULTISPECIES: cytochrome C oxidase subunit IV family protein [Nocardia]|uniref:Cytochrome C oxidase subunit IV family protein n=1 Tax=Nocardia vinacea TaxID=96468 RepID=A0ABZ1YLH3_9NOCA|nr:cytochrome C oxidase subunit IV family protein [Nocardia vinacea]
MHTAFNKRLLIGWLVLSSITLLYLLVDSGDHGGTLEPSTVITSAAIVMALIKVRIIFQEFMEVRRAPALLCRLTDVWILLIAAGLLGSYYVGLAVQ